MMRFILSVVFAAILLAGAGGFVFYRTLSHSGDNAVAAMDADETAYLDKLALVRRGMSYQEVVDLLGSPGRSGGGFRPTWCYKGSPFSQVAVYFDTDGADKVRWISLGKFIYERRL